MRRTVSSLLIAGVALVAVGLGHPAQAAPSTTGADASFSTQGALDRSVATVGSSTGRAAAVRFVEPAASPASFELGVPEIEAYWYWASGVEGTLSGFLPGEPLQVTDTSPSGAVLRFERLTAGSDGSLTHTFTAQVLDPEVGTHQLRAVGATSGYAGAVTLDVTRNADELLRVSATPVTVTQDQFLRTGLTVRAEGLGARQRVFFNLLGPDGSGQAIGIGEGLRSNAQGGFSYQLRSLTIDSPVGEWTATIVGPTGIYGSVDFVVSPTPVAPVQQGSLAMGASTITGAQFAQDGVPFALTGFKRFDAFDLQLITPRGLTVPLGSARTNGVGTRTDRVTTTQADVPLGTYSVRITSRSTGNFATATFAVATADGTVPANATLSLSPQALAADQLEDPAGGLTVAIRNVPADALVVIGMISPDLYMVPLRDGVTASGSRNLYLQSDADGSLDTTLTSARTWDPGTYTVQVYVEDGQLSRSFELAAATSTSAGQDSPAATTTSPTGAPTATSTPAGPTTPATSSSAAPSTAAPTGTPATTAPTTSASPAAPARPSTGAGSPVRPPVVVPTQPAR